MGAKKWKDDCSEQKRKDHCDTGKGGQTAAAATTTTTKVTTAKKNRKGKPKARLDAIVLQPTSVKTYADVLSKIRSSVDPKTAGVEVRSIRRTKTWQVLLKLKKSSTESRTTFTEKLKSVVGSEIAMRVLVPRSVLEIRDLDECITAAEVESSLKRDLPDYKGFLQISTTKPNDRGQRMAIVTVEESAAALVMSKARIKLGWVNCRIRSRLTVLRCFMCPGYGHQSMACKGPDRSKLCFRCGKSDVKIKDCSEIPRCFLYSEQQGTSDSWNHVAGSENAAPLKMP